MKLVIDIDEEYRSIFEDNRCKEKFDSLATNEFGYVLRKAFENGKSLPKGHGRLKDVDWIDDNCPDYRTEDGAWCYKWEDIDNAPMIIEAESEE